MFSEEDINQLENGGYSVSETDGDGDGDSGLYKSDGKADLTSLRSGFSGAMHPRNGLMGSPDQPMAKDPNLAPFFPERFQTHFGANQPTDVENIIRQ